MANPFGLTLEEQAALAQAPRLAPEKQWWNLAAKKAAGERIGHEEDRKFAGRHNDAGDAMRHAEWSQRMATDIGPIFSGRAGLYHEGDNLAHAVAGQYGKAYDPLLKGDATAYNVPEHPSITQTLSESGMDLWNNAQGIAAALAGHPIDPSRLQTRPVIPGYR
jgi:hypothetical protein